MTIIETMDSGERGMIPVTMTVINPQKKILTRAESLEQATSCSQVLILSQTISFRFFQTERGLQTTISKLMKMAESSLNG